MARWIGRLTRLMDIDDQVEACRRISFSLGATSRAVDPFRRAFGIPEEYYPVGAIAIGHPAPDRPSPSLGRGRRPPGEVLHFGEWGD